MRHVGRSPSQGIRNPVRRFGLDVIERYFGRTLLGENLPERFYFFSAGGLIQGDSDGILIERPQVHASLRRFLDDAGGASRTHANGHGIEK